MKGLGTDIVEISRLMEAIEHHGQSFIDHILTPREQKLTPQLEKIKRSFYAGRWAAKEAVAKALGCGFGAECGWLDIEVLRNELGAPYVILSGAAQQRALECGIGQVQISISHEENYAVATAIALEEDK